MGGHLKLASANGHWFRLNENLLDQMVAYQVVLVYIDSPCKVVDVFKATIRNLVQSSRVDVERQPSSGVALKAFPVTPHIQRLDLALINCAWPSRHSNGKPC
jgi:hypothetical protein